MITAVTVRAIRKAQGLTQEQFAVKYGVTRNFMMRVENGWRQPTAAMLLKMLEDTVPGLESQINKSEGLSQTLTKGAA